MELTLEQAATILGRTKRATRAAIRRGALEGVKRGGRWFVSRESLLDQPGEQARARRRADEIRAAVERSLPKSSTPRVADLVPFVVTTEVWRAATAAGHTDAVEPLCCGLDAIAQGHYAYQPDAKQRAWREARGHLACAVARLHRVGDAAGVAALEDRALPLLAGLLRWAEGLGRRRPAEAA